MKTILLTMTALLAFSAACARAQTLPQPAHIVIVMEENHSYNEIIGAQTAPYINALAQSGALFTNSHGVEHPSQPNYLDIYSGANQGVVADNTSLLAPFTTANLGAELLAQGLTFADYSQGLPSVGFTGDNAGGTDGYYRKHNPAVNWQNDINPQANQLPSSVNQPFATFPADYSQLPTVSFVIPNQANDMHNGTVAQGDTWLQSNLGGYAQWAQTHNSLLIVTWDENDDTAVDPSTPTNQIATIFTGQGVQPGQYGELVTHYNVLQTVQDMYGLGHAGVTGLNGAANPAILPITDAFASPAPEPSQWLTLAMGTVGLLALRRRARK